MPANIEIKAKAVDACRQSQIAFQLADCEPEVIRQEDFFFPSPNGRLKLRILSATKGELIFYQRPDRPSPKESNYLISETGNPLPLKDVLASAYGILGTVEKSRSLYLSGQTRIHLDEVENLGTFLELEVVMQDGQTKEEGIQIAEGLMKKLQIEEDHLIDKAYIDLLLEESS